MNSTTRFLLSISALTLAAITIASALILGPAAPLTVSTFAFLTIYGIVEIGLVTSAPTVSVRLPRTAPAPVAAVPTVVRPARVSAVIEYPVANAARRAA